MSTLITPDELPHWVPGTQTASSKTLAWRGVELRGYRYDGQAVRVPPLRDFLIVSYDRGATAMARRSDGRWKKTKCAPGSVSLLTNEQHCEWNWTEDIDVQHVYLTSDFLVGLAAEALDKHVDSVRLRDVLNVDDPVITTAVRTLRAETNGPGVGGQLLAEAVATQLAVHLLRDYATVSMQIRSDDEQLSALARQRIGDYVQAHLAMPIKVEALAREAGLGTWRFSQRFQETFGCAPYAYVLRQRALKARELVEQSSLALKQIAPRCGFNDQAHLTRVFKSHFGVTPGKLRREAKR